MIWVQENAQKTNGSVCFQICGIIWFRFDIWWTSDVYWVCDRAWRSIFVFGGVFVMDWCAIRIIFQHESDDFMVENPCTRNNTWVFFFSISYIDTVRCSWFVVDFEWTIFFFFSIFIRAVELNTSLILFGRFPEGTDTVRSLFRCRHRHRNGINWQLAWCSSMIISSFNDFSVFFFGGGGVSLSFWLWHGRTRRTSFTWFFRLIWFVLDAFLNESIVW